MSSCKAGMNEDVDDVQLTDYDTDSDTDLMGNGMQDEIEHKKV